MNKFLASAAVILLILSGYLGYRVYELTHPRKVIANTPLIKTCTSLPYDYSKGEFEGIITYETAQELFNNYKNDEGKSKIWPAGNNIANRFVEKEDDSRSVWFSFEKLKRFLWNIEKQNCQKCGDSLGLRIYFGKYPDLKNTTFEDLASVPKEYSNHHTVFMVPTYRNENGAYVDFYPEGETCRTPLKSSPIHPIPGEGLYAHDKVPYILLFDMSGAAPSGNSQNHGGLIPPGDPAGTSFNP
jgi:hypothetical protein